MDISTVGVMSNKDVVAQDIQQPNLLTKLGKRRHILKRVPIDVKVVPVPWRYFALGVNRLANWIADTIPLEVSQDADNLTDSLLRIGGFAISKDISLVVHLHHLPLNGPVDGLLSLVQSG